MDKPYGYMGLPPMDSPLPIPIVVINVFAQHLRTDHNMTDYEICHALGLSLRELTKMSDACNGT